MEKFSFQWHITDRCDQRCKHCYIYSEEMDKKVDELNIKQMKLIVSKMKRFCKKYNKEPFIYLTGGDPILNKDFWKLLDLLKKNKIRFFLMGNPFHIDDEICKKIASYGCVAYQMSLDGLEKTHDKFRKKGSYKETVSKIDCINKSGMKSVIMTTVSEININELPDLLEESVKYKVKSFNFARYCPTSNEKSNQIKPLEYRNLLTKMLNKYIELKNDNSCQTIMYFKDHLWNLYLYEIRQYKIPDIIEEDKIYDGCNCARRHITILPNGDVYACRRMKSKVGNIFKSSFNRIWNSEKMNEYRKYNDFKKCKNCELLKFCRGCPAVAAGTTNMYDVDPQCWK